MNDDVQLLRSRQLDPAPRPGGATDVVSPARMDSAASPTLAALLAEARVQARATKRQVLVSVAEQVGMVDPLAALDAVRRRAQADAALAAHVAAGTMFWTRPRDGFAIIGVGAAATLSPGGADRFDSSDNAWSALLDDALVSDLSEGAEGVGPVLMGGFAFEANGPRAAHWADFPAALLVLPRVQITTVGGATWLTTTLLVGANGSPDIALAELARLRDAMLSPVSRSAPAGSPSGCSATIGQLALDDELPANAWREVVSDAVAAIRDGQMDKVVLARAVRASAPGEPDLLAMLRHLRAAYPDCHVFGCWRGDAAFVGASPERLVRLDDREVRASSLAGSAPRGATRGEDAALSAGLLASAKDRAEHAMVRAALCEGLADLCDDVVAPAEPSLFTLPHVHHLHTAVRARLRPGHSLLDLVAKLHPTPAVGGAPRETALRFIRNHEHLDRGWYAAPVGWIGREGGEFAVALRSALVRGREAWLFAGSGIVADSDPNEEYAETLLKLRPMEQALMMALAARRDESESPHAGTPDGAAR